MSQIPIFLKNFLDWFNLKPQLDTLKKAKNFNEREVWWCHLGTNIGFEIDGKTTELTRPVLIIKKISHQIALILPLSTKAKIGSWFVPIIVNQKQAIVILSQSRTIDNKRLKTRMKTVPQKEFQEIKQKFIYFLQN